MRVISGTARGTKLRSLELEQLRPMLDRVKEALFNIIRDRIEGARVLDAFGGIGALGIEALSRGAARCVFVERDARLVRVLEQNLAKCHVTDQADVMRGDFFSLPALFAPQDSVPTQLAFFDPPYAMVEDPNRRAALFAAMEEIVGSWIEPGALMVLHHAPMPHAVWPTRVLECTDRRVYGKSQLSFFQVLEDAADGTR
jgi:16S rRNA (guanine(966)-N(2))-methyltransferase RsmD